MDTSITLEEVWKLFRETDRKFQETDRKIETIQRSIGDLGSRFGDFVQSMVKPAVIQLFQERGIFVRRVMENVYARDEQGRFVLEIDLLLIDSDHAVAVECKSKASSSDVDEHIERLDLFKKHFPEYNHLRLHGAMAAMVFPEDVARYAYRQGLYVLAQNGANVELLNDAAFRPRAW